MLENRKNPRFMVHPSPRALIEGVVSGDTSLLDISITGCRVAYNQNNELKTDTQYMINIIPEKESHIGDFEITANLIWIRKGESSSEAGFFIQKSPEGKQFERYVDYLSWRTSKNSENKK